MIFRILAALLFITIIAGSFWLGGEQRATTPSTTTVESSSVDLGYSARNAVLIETGTDGLPVYTLNADVVHQHPSDGVTFEQVQMSFRDADGQIWKGRADEGDLATDTGKVHLKGNVQVDGVLPGSSEVANLTTDTLSVDTHEDIITTPDAVVVDEPGRQLKAKGLLAELKEHHLVLESDVRGTFTR